MTICCWANYYRLKLPMDGLSLKLEKEAINVLYDIFKSNGDDHRWGSYFIITGVDKKLVGTCCFKGRPDENNYVEIGYEVNSKFQNLGFATEVALRLLQLAFAEGLGGVIAHTLPQENASTNVLKKCGFRLVGEMLDPEDGLIWKWLYQRSNQVFVEGHTIPLGDTYKESFLNSISSKILNPRK